MARLLLLFIVVPVIELALLIQLGKVVGLAATLGLIVFTGALGAYLARRQGLAVLGRVRSEMADGHIPAGPIVDGVIILLATVGMNIKNRIHGNKAEVVEIVGLYWHFVDIVWILIFTLVYLVPA